MKRLSLLASIVGVCAMSSIASAQFNTTYDQAAFRSLIRTDYIASGSLATTLLLPRPPVGISGAGHDFTIDSNNPSSNRLVSWNHGIGAPDPINSTIIRTARITNTAVGCSLFVTNASSAAVGGPVRITFGFLNAAGDTWSSSSTIDVNVPANGTWFGFTTDAQFNAVAFQATNLANVEMIDNVIMGDRLGSSMADQCIGTDVIALSNAYWGTSMSIDNRYTTADLSGFVAPAGGSVAGNRDLWTRVTFQQDGELVATSNTLGSLVPFDSVLAAYDASSGSPAAGARPIAYDHNGNTHGPVAVSEVRIPVSAGHIYAIRVGSFAAATGTGSLQLVFTASHICPADTNRDGIVDFFDYLDYLQSFSGGC